MKGKLMSGIIVVTAMCSCTGNQAEADFGKVIPLPERMEMTGEGEFTLGRGVPVVFDGDDPDMARNAGFLKDYLKSDIGLEPVLRPDGRGDNAIVLEQDTLMTEEEYRITVGEDGIVIAGGSPKGVFYGIQTLRKSVPAQEGKSRGVIFPFGEVSAAPRFAYRGMHSDVVRHWFPVSYMKKYIDLMAFHGMNTLHWHLSDDQGWRIEIKRYPELTEKGSYRDGTMVGRDTSVFDGVPVSGYFTQDEIREVVKYAADRYITVIPEIDVPGHMMAALHCYPQLGCTGGPYEVSKIWGVMPDILCAGNEEAFDFLEGVFNEICSMFPSEYIHIGGDEAPRVRWEACPKCQARIRAEGLEDDVESSAEAKLQSYFMTRVEDFLRSKGRSVIGWDEILEGGVSQSATIMSWRGVDGGLEAARRGHDVIMTPCQYMYFDYYQTDDFENEPMAMTGYVPLEKVYGFEPMLPEMTPEECSHILGVQANLWAEYISTPEHAFYMALPRMAALSEVQWLQPEQKDWDSFEERLQTFVKFYDRDGYSYHPLAESAGLD